MLPEIFNGDNRFAITRIKVGRIKPHFPNFYLLKVISTNFQDEGVMSTWEISLHQVIHHQSSHNLLQFV